MTMSESRRFVMQIGLRKDLGDEVAEILLEHLPPSGWSDVARQSDVDRLEGRIDRLESRLDRRIDGVVYGLWAMGGIMVTGFFGLFAVIITKF